MGFLDFAKQTLEATLGPECRVSDEKMYFLRSRSHLLASCLHNLNLTVKWTANDWILACQHFGPQCEIAVLTPSGPLSEEANVATNLSRCVYVQFESLRATFARKS